MLIPAEFWSQRWFQIRYLIKSIFDSFYSISSLRKNRSMLRIQATARDDIKFILMPEISLMDSSHNDGHRSDICGNRFLTTYRGHHLRQRINQCSYFRQQPDTKLRLFWCQKRPWWILVTTVVSDQIFDKIDFWPLVEGIIFDKESINAPTLGISQKRY